MAGDWIKMRMDLRQDPAVLALAPRLSADEDTIVGKLHRFWSWASANTPDGKLPDIDCETIDRIVDLSGFAEALMGVKWLKRGKKRGLVIPKFGAHMSSSAKARAGEALRKARQRKRLGADRCPDTRPDNSGTRARAAESKEENRTKTFGSAGPLRFAPPDKPRPAAATPADAARNEITRLLSRLQHAGKLLFSTRTAASIALHHRATRGQVAWAIERFKQAAAQGVVDNPSGYLRHLILREHAPPGWIEQHRHEQMVQIAECRRKQEQLLHGRVSPGAVAMGSSPQAGAPISMPVPNANASARVSAAS